MDKTVSEKQDLDDSSSNLIFNKTVEVSQMMKTPQPHNLSMNSSLQKLELKAPESFEQMEDRLLKQVNDEINDAKLVVEDKKSKQANEQQYASFLDNEQAKQFMLQIENYNELNLFDFKN